MRYYTLFEACDFIKDGTHSSPVRTREGIPVLSATNVVNGTLNYDTDRFTNETELQLFRQRLKPQQGDVLLTIVGTIGRVAILKDNRPLVFQRSVCVLRPKKSILSSNYLYYVLESSDVKDQLERETHEVAQAGVYLEALNKIKISLPSLEEQRRIVSILAKADRLRRLRHYALELSSTYLQSVFLEMFGDPLTNPNNWEHITLGDVIHSAQDGPHVSPSYVPNGIPFLSTRNIRAGEIIWEDLKYISLQDAKIQWKKCKPERGDILYTKGGTTGLAKAVDFDRDIAVWVHVALLKTNHQLVDPIWLEGMLNSKFCYAQSQELTHGIANRDLGLSRMVKIKMFLPPISLQKQYIQVAKKFSRLQAQQREAERQAEHLFQTLLHKAFQGELSTGEAEEQIEALEIASPSQITPIRDPSTIETSVCQLALPME